MRPIRLALLLALVAHIAPAAPGTPAACTTLASNNTAFACDLYAQLKTQDGNLFFSPYSISTALAMTYAGARGETATQMAQALHFSQPQAELHPAFAALGAQMNAVQAAGNVKLSIANSLWPHKGYPFLDDYLTLVKKNYGGTITPVDYAHAEPQARAQINRWVEEKTQKRIQNLLVNPLPPLTRLLLVNAVYFKGDWESPFKTNRTENAPFFVAEEKSIQTPLMTQTHSFKYGEWETTQVIELPYAGNELSMLVILPAGKSPQALADIEKSLSAASLQHWRESLHKQEVSLFLPRFKVTWGTQSLKNPLHTLGIRDAFGFAADFSGMDGGKMLYIFDVLHKAFVQVNEEGTEAAAATAVIMKLRCATPQPKIFRADHPFLFLIQENTTGTILFMGRVMDPTAQ